MFSFVIFSPIRIVITFFLFYCAIYFIGNSCSLMFSHVLSFLLFYFSLATYVFIFVAPILSLVFTLKYLFRFNNLFSLYLSYYTDNVSSDIIKDYEGQNVIAQNKRLRRRNLKFLFSLLPNLKRIGIHGCSPRPIIYDLIGNLNAFPSPLESNFSLFFSNF